MAIKKAVDSPLVAAAKALDAELLAFEQAARALARAPLESQRHLERVGRMLEDLGGGEDRLGERLGALVQAIAAAREAREAQLLNVRERAREIEHRTAEFQSLLTRYAALGEQAARLNEILTGAAGDEPAPDAIEAVDRGLAELTAAAQALYAAARDAGFIDVSRLADTLRQQLASTRARLRKADARTLH